MRQADQKNEFSDVINMLKRKLMRTEKASQLSEDIANRRINALYDSTLKSKYLNATSSQSSRKLLLSLIHRMAIEPKWTGILVKLDRSSEYDPTKIEETILYTLTFSEIPLDFQLVKTREDEFVVGIKDLKSIGVETICDEIRKAILKQTETRGNVTHFASASIGFTQKLYQKSFSTIMIRLTQSIQYARRTGGNKVVNADLAHMRNEDLDERGFSADVYHSILQGNFWFAFQPIYDVASGIVITHEALIRTELNISQHEFVLKLQGLLSSNEAIQIKRALFSKMFDQLVHVVDQKIKNVSINCDLFELEDDSLFKVLIQFIEDLFVLGIGLTVEILENPDAKFSSKVILKSRLQTLQSAGVKIALDDFGMNQSNLSRLVEFDVDYVKLDRSLIQSIETDVKARAVVSATRSLCVAIGIDIVAEGVETKSQKETLLSLGINRHQGFLYAR